MVMEKETLEDTVRSDSVNPHHGDVPPGYKKTEVGVIPADWGDIPLFSCLIRTPDYGINAPSVTFDDTLPTYLRITDISDDNQFKPFPQVSVKHPYAELFYLSEGDLVFARTGASVGKSYLYNRNDGELVFAGYLIRVQANSTVLEPRFLSYYVQTKRYWDWVTTMSIRSGQPGINGREYGSLHIPFPPIPEQHAIAAALSDADALIQALEKLIEKKRALKQGTMQQLLTGRIRLPGFAKNSGFKNTEVGEIPEDWEITTLGSVCQIFGRIGFRGYTINDIVPDGEGAIAISPSNIQGYRTEFSECTYISWHKYEESPEIKINNGDVLLVKTGSTYGKTAIVQNLPEKATLNPQVVVLKRIRINSCYLSHVMAFSVIQNQIANAVVGGAVPTLSQKLVEKFKLPLPDLIEQTAIATVFSDMDAEITALEHRLDKARQIKQGMMQQLLTGKIRLVPQQEAEATA